MSNSNSQLIKIENVFHAQKSANKDEKCFSCPKDFENPFWRRNLFVLSEKMLLDLGKNKKRVL